LQVSRIGQGHRGPTALRPQVSVHRGVRASGAVVPSCNETIQLFAQVGHRSIRGLRRPWRWCGTPAHLLGLVLLEQNRNLLRLE
jgi:hypothetical protein